ncbi:hypothetical protein C8R47DRAFT_136562 [Mycena vitilis]|nr:hypothetical protein C8R47DRAFT_136562 [Mycena vitilis]
MELHPCVRRHAVYILTIILLPIASAALESYPQTPLRAISWACAKVTQGLASGAFALTMWMVCWLARNAFVWLIRALGVSGQTTVGPTPAEVEDGGVRDLAVHKTDSTATTGCTAPTPAGKPKTLTTLDKLIAVLVNTTFFFYAFLTRVPSPRSPSRDNGHSYSAEEILSTALKYILSGWVVLAIGFVLLVLRKMPEEMRRQRCLDQQGIPTAEAKLDNMSLPEGAGGEVEEATTEKVQGCATH